MVMVKSAELAGIHRRLVEYGGFYERYFPESITNYSPRVRWEAPADGKLIEPVYLPLGITLGNVLGFLEGSFEIVDYCGVSKLKDVRSSPGKPYVVFHAGGRTPDDDLIGIPGQEVLEAKIPCLTLLEYLVWLAERSTHFGVGETLPDSEGTATLCQTVTCFGNFCAVFVKPKLSRITIDAVYPVRSDGLKPARRYGARQVSIPDPVLTENGR